MSKPLCQASVRNQSFQFFGNEVFTTTECGKPSFKKVTVDDGDAFFHICHECLAKYLTKLRPGTSWIGWFDCDINPEARVKGSKWYWSVMLAEYNKANTKTPLTYPTPIVLNKWYASLAAPAPNPKDELEKKIVELQEWMKTTGKTANPFETMKKIKELKELKAKLESL